MRKRRSVAVAVVAATALILTGTLPTASQANVATVTPGPDWVGPLAPDLPIAKSYDSAAAGFAAVSDNPMTKWEYRVWCQTGYHHARDAGKGQPVDLPLPNPRRDLVSPLGFLDPSQAQVMPQGGVRFMENAWYFGTDYTGMVVTRTPNGSLLVFDTLTNPADVSAQFLGQARAAGLDLKRITTIFLGHHHGDHIGGANTIRENYAPNAKIVMSEPDAEIVRQRLRDLRANRDQYTKEEFQARLAVIPKTIDETVAAYPGHTVGMRKITAGGVKVTAMLAPGHTVGQMAVIVPVVHGGQTRNLIVWSGNDNMDAAAQYAVSTEFITGVAKQAGADAFINTHAYQFGAFAYLRDLKANPAAPNYFLMGTEGVQQHLQVFALCQRAAAQRLIDGTWKQM
jgi:glyoxylase-like metal-dependent hydrolase (beta-lactamase superfamily II)